MTTPAGSAARGPPVTLRERALEIGLRAGVVVAIAALAVALARSLGYHDALPPLPVTLLGARTVTLQTLLIGGIAGLLALVAVIAKRAGTMVFALATTLILWMGFPYSQLRWYRFVPGLDALKRLTGLDAGPWLAGAALLAVATAFVVGDAAIRTRSAYRAKAADEAAAEAAAGVARGGARALAAGVGAAAVAALLTAALLPLARGAADALPRVNPVLALLAGGLLLVAALHGLLRARDVTTGERVPFFRPRDAPATPAVPPAQAGNPHADRSPRDDAMHAYLAEEVQKDRDRSP